MKTYSADLHIHTCLSPCAEIEMSPKNIVKKAKEMNLDIIGICDHNTCENVPYVKRSAKNHGVHVIGGIEVTSKEEAHLLALFASTKALYVMQKIIYDNLSGLNDANKYGDQIVVNENNEILRFNTKLLIGATSLSVEQIVDYVHSLGGIAIASHIDRGSFSIVSQLGFIPPGLKIDAVEISNKENIDVYRDLLLPMVMFSDAHQTKDIGKNITHFRMNNVSLKEMHKSLLAEDNRKITV